MQRVRSVAMLASLIALPPCIAQAPSVLTSRWDLTIQSAKGEYPSWIEIVNGAGTPAIRIVGRTGSVHLVHQTKAERNDLWFEEPPSRLWHLSVKDRKMTGQAPDGSVIGVPAPALDSKVPTAWSDPQLLFNGHDLDGWEPDNPAANHWSAQDGDLINSAAGANLRTTRTFADFKLHIEYNCPLGGNSGVYLRGRYEVQVEYEPPSKNDAFHAMGSIYGFIAPAVAVNPRPGQWESYDVTLTGRNVTVVRDGVPIIVKQSIPGITGGAIDSHEGEPGPIYLQGDHSGGLKYRHITISLPQR